ncbi:MAG: hypothetical protein ACLP70_13940 [Streptosporangiaceae bacterium]
MASSTLTLLSKATTASGSIATTMRAPASALDRAAADAADAVDRDGVAEALVFICPPGPQPARLPADVP